MGCIFSNKTKNSKDIELNDRDHQRNGSVTNRVKTIGVETEKPNYNPDPPPVEVIQIDESQYRQVVALFNYERKSPNDMSFMKGDIFLVLDDQDNDWWSAYNVKTKEKGYIPSNYVNPIEESATTEEKTESNNEFYHPNLLRIQAEQILLVSETPGTFLIRDSDKLDSPYTISILDNTRRVKHFRIRFQPGSGYSINAPVFFKTLTELVEHYRQPGSSETIRLGKCIPRSTPDTQGLGKDIWEIDPASIDCRSRLGSGFFGEVWKAMFNDTTWVAVKTFKEGKMDPSEFLKEATIMKGIKHRRLVQLLAVCTVGRPLMIVVEYMEHGSLKDYLPKRKHSIPFGILLSMCVQVSEGMTYIESVGMVHRDLAARNVLISKDCECKIADFGMAMLTNDQGIVNQVKSKVPVRWTPPEAIQGGIFSSKSDIWSFGVTMWEIMSYCELPYINIENKKICEYVLQGNILPKPSISSEELYEVMKSCWTLEVDKRPRFSEISINIKAEETRVANNVTLYNEL